MFARIFVCSEIGKTYVSNEPSVCFHLRSFTGILGLTDLQSSVYGPIVCFGIYAFLSCNSM